MQPPRDENMMRWVVFDVGELTLIDLPIMDAT